MGLITRFKNFLRTDLFRASFLNGIANIVRMFTGMVSNKVVAVYLGPSGVALLGQFQNFCSMVLSLAGLGINNGITKYIAENKQDELHRKKIISTGLYLILFGSIIALIVVFSFRFYFSDYVLNTLDYVPVFILFAATLILFVLNAFFIAVLNGYKQFRKIVLVNISSSLLSLTIAIIMVIHYGVYGAFIGYILSQTLVFFVTLNWVLRSDWFKLKTVFGHFDKAVIGKLGKYTLMSFVSVFAVTYIQLRIRTYIIDNLSLNEAGYWQGITKICELYITFVTTTLGIYYLPRLSELKTDRELRKEIFLNSKFIIPLVIVSSLFVFFLRDFIIDLLFSKEFRPMRNLFAFQILGNILKICSWLISYLMVAKTLMKTYIISEIASGLLYYLLTVIFLTRFGIIGVTYAYFLHYLVYFLAMVIIFRKVLFLNVKQINQTHN